MHSYKPEKIVQNKSDVKPIIISDRSNRADICYKKLSGDRATIVG